MRRIFLLLLVLTTITACDRSFMPYGGAKSDDVKSPAYDQKFDINKPVAKN